MNSGTITDQLLDAVQVLVDDAVNKAGYDKTVQAVIAQCISVTKGQYTVKYQGGYFYAYSQDPDVIYIPETQVYVLIPGNDMSRTKTILGTVDKLGDNFTYKEEIASVYENTGSNICSTESGTEFELHSYKATDNITLYEKDLVNNPANDTFVDNFNLDVAAAEMFLKKSDSLMIAANFRTALPFEHRVKGNYGLKCTLTFEDPISGVTAVDREYILDVNSMNGDPYIQISNLKQTKVEPIDSLNFKYIKKIELFSEGFETTTIAEKEDIADIFASNIELMGVNEAQEDEKTGYILNLNMSPRGYFNSSDGDSAIIKTNASFFKKGLKQNLSSNDVVYYWFKEDASIEYNSKGYLSYGGRGWKCLNELAHYKTDDLTYLENKNYYKKTKNNNIETYVLLVAGTNYTVGDTIDEYTTSLDSKYCEYKEYYTYNNSLGIYELLKAGEDYTIGDTISSGSVFEKRNIYEEDTKYLHGESYLEVKKSNNPARENKYKCVVVFKDTLAKMEKEFIIYNLSSNYIITLTADVADLSDANTATLTCSVVGAAGLELNYYWSQIIDSTLPAQDLGTTGTTNTKTVNLTNAIENVLYKCLVKNGDQTIGYAELNIHRGYKEVPGTYYIEIHNDNQIFKYDTDGNSPADETLINPQQIQPLTFTLYGPDGEEINHEDLSAIIWTAPDSNTMIDTTSGTTTDELIFTIKNKYNPNAINNTINLRVNYNDLVIRAKANLTFLKEGDNGSNGTAYYLKVEPNYVGEAPNGRVYYYYKDSTHYGFNFTKVENEFPFKVLFYRDGEKIYDSHDVNYREIIPTINFNFLKRKYCKYLLLQNGNEIPAVRSDESRFSIDNENNTIICNSTDISTSAGENSADILRCTLTYDGLTWIYDYPIIYIKYTSDGYNIKLPKESGFIEVVYTEDGRNPQYKGNHNFIINTTNNSTEIETDNVWTVQGQIYDSQWQSVSNLLIKNENEIYAKELYDGNCVTNALYGIINIENDGQTIEIARIHLPIVMHLNTYANKFINEWNGNAIELNEEGGIILTPQFAAGQKENDNTFTGVVGGKAKESNSSTIESGIFGYNHGIRTFELNAQNGQAKFGRSGDSQIIIAPEEEQDDLAKHSIIRSADYRVEYIKVDPTDKYEDSYIYFKKMTETNYQELRKNIDYKIGDLIETDNIYRNKIGSSEGGAGLEIDLTDPHIRFGSGTFRVENDGTIFGTHFISKTELDDSLEDLKNIIEGTSNFAETVDTTYQPNKNYYFINDNDEYVLLLEGVDYNISYFQTSDTIFETNKIYYKYDLGDNEYGLLEAEKDYHNGRTIGYIITSDEKYLENKTYYKYENSAYVPLVAGRDYEIGETIGNFIYEHVLIYEANGDPIPRYILTNDEKYKANVLYYIYNNSTGLYDLWDNYTVGDPVFNTYQLTQDGYYKNYKNYYAKKNENEYILLRAGEDGDYEIGKPITEYKITLDTVYKANKSYYIYDETQETFVELQGIQIGAIIDNPETYEKNYVYEGIVSIYENIIIYEMNVIEGLDEKLQTLADGIKTINDTMLIQTADQFQMLFTETKIGDNLRDLSDLIDVKSKSWDQVTSHITFTINGIEIGKSGAQSRLIIGNDKISFMTGTSESAYISENQLYITDSTILNKLQVGHWETKEDAYHNLNTRWIND